MSDSGFVKADGRNLPTVDLYMILNFFNQNTDFNILEVRGWKAGHSTRSSYIDSAIGYVDLKRDGKLCIIRGKVCPEHKIRQKLYSVGSKINEDAEEIISVDCHDCTASDGGCKHAIAFIMWLHERSSDPSPTDVACYWKKPKLSRIQDKKVATVADFKKIEDASVQNANTVCQEFLAHLQPFSKVLFTQMYLPSEFDSLDLHVVGVKFKQSVQDRSYGNFMPFLKSQITSSDCDRACRKSMGQSNSSLWHTLRYARITGSTVHEIAHAVQSVSLKEKLFGVSKVPLTAAIKRGKSLEGLVFKEVCAELKIKFKNEGFLISSRLPIFGASPDGVSEDSILEIKCPIKDKTISNYVKGNVLAQKVRDQMQLQMLIFKKNKGILAVADPNFETNKKVNYYYDTLDPVYLKDLCRKAENYWIRNILPELIK